MAALKMLKKLIHSLDMFYSSEMLRYNSETQYKTLTGGILSLAIICVITAGFANMISDTLRQVSITSNLVVTKQSDPPYAALVPGAENMFMLGVAIKSYDFSYQVDLSQGPQHFSIVATILQIQQGVLNETSVPLEACTKEHWRMMPEFLEGFDTFYVGRWLCLPVGYALPLQGTYTSAENYQVMIQVYPCSNDTSSNCASQDEINALFAKYKNFYLAFDYVNPVINPNQPNFISYYIEGNDYLLFSETIGAEAWIHFSDYTITTDNSIWPYSVNSVKQGCIVEQKAVNHPYSVNDMTSYATLFLAKSQNSLAYTRQVQKISAVFSYIGGLVGAVTAVLFLIKSYTDNSLEMAIGFSLFQSKEQACKDRFNFSTYIKLAFHRFLKFCGWTGKSPQVEQIQSYQREALRQLDVGMLLKRIIKLQSSLSRLFSWEQLKEIWHDDPITVEGVRKMRQLLEKDEQQTMEKLSEAKTVNDVESVKSSKKSQKGKIEIKGDQIQSKLDSSNSMQKRLNIDDLSLNVGQNDKNPATVIRVYQQSHRRANVRGRPRSKQLFN